jgi:putative SOS response-associated peptidase YedK
LLSAPRIPDGVIAKHRLAALVEPSCHLVERWPTPSRSSYDPKAGERSLDLTRRGLVPFWAKDIKVGFSNINPKAKGIEAKPAFREAFQRRCCLVPVGWERSLEI